ncbi:MAG: DUF2723 domain-containing protein [Kouleothrix sp.]|nr:DUF2723 domain-containing protein [Kouleothrix sp.]
MGSRDAPAGRARRADALIGAGLAVAAFALYLATLLPGLGSGDTAEFQRVLPTLGVAHPTGYPLYTILGWLWSQLPLGGAPAWRVSLLSAFAAALAVGVVYLVARALGQARVVAAAAALALAASRTFWSQATIAEVYALAALLQALLLLALLRWRGGRWPLWVAGLLLGLGLAHHRTIVLMIPGALLFVGLGARGLGVGAWGKEPSSSLKPQAGYAILATLAGCLLYLYLPLRAPPWLDSWQTFLQHISGSEALSVWLTIDAPGRVALEHLRELAQRLIWPQLSPVGALLALVGALRLWRRDRASAALLVSGYLLTLLFCVLFYVQDVEVFMISAHLIAALLIGAGAMAALERLNVDTLSRSRIQWISRAAGQPNVQTFKRANVLTIALVALPAFLLASNLPAIRAANTPAGELAARALLAQPLPEGALLLIDWESVEPLRYLQQIEGRRPDVEVRPLNADVVRQDVDAALAAGRATYLLRAQPSLGLAQSPEGRLWRVSDRPLDLRAASPADQRWQDGIALTGYTLGRGPYQPGQIVPVTLGWRALAAPRASYTLFVHIVGADGKVWGQQDRPPAQAATDRWRAGDRVVDLYGPTLPIDTPPGRYDVVIGWYSYPSLERLPLASSAADSLTLGEIEVEALR